MRNFVMAVVVALLVVVSGNAFSSESLPEYVWPLPESLAPQPAQRKAAVRINTGTGICSGTKVSHNVILSAAHCFSHSRIYLVIDNHLYLIKRILQDTNDHALVVVDGMPFTDFVAFGPAPIQGDDIYYWGNANGLDMLLRRGHVAGFDNMNTLYNVNGYMGDSGAGVFNNKNELVSVISYIHIVNSFSMMGSFPLNFTPKQLKAVGLPETPLLSTGIRVTINMK